MRLSFCILSRFKKTLKEDPYLKKFTKFKKTLKEDPYLKKFTKAIKGNKLLICMREMRFIFHKPSQIETTCSFLAFYILRKVKLRYSVH